jgi:hypothetical protein
MSTETPEREPVNKPTPENVADMLTAGDNDFHDGNEWYPSISVDGNVVKIEVTPLDADGEQLHAVHFRAVVVEGEEAPLVLEWPAELGMSWPDGGDLLALASDGIVFCPRGVDEWVMDPDEARELAAQLAAMADACEAANGGASNG